MIQGISSNNDVEGKLEILYSVDSEEFEYSGFADLNGKVKWPKYTENVPALKVISLFNGKCITDEEGVFTCDDEVIEEITSQKANPYVGSETKLIPTKKINGTVACLYMGGLDVNYYHFNVEFLIRWWLLIQSGVSVDYYLCASETKFAMSFYKLMGIEDKILRFPKGTVLQCERLIVPSLINNWEMHRAINYAPLYWKRWLPSCGRGVYSYIRDRIDLNKYESAERVYISRNHSDRRIIENEKELLEVLEKYDFSVRYMEELSVEQQIALFANAKVIIAPHGAGLVNMSYCNEKAKILELYPRNYHDPSFRLQAQFMQLDYNYLVCKKTKMLGLRERPDSQNIFLSKKDLSAIESFITK